MTRFKWLFCRAAALVLGVLVILAMINHLFGLGYFAPHEKGLVVYLSAIGAVFTLFYVRAAQGGEDSNASGPNDESR